MPNKEPDRTQFLRGALIRATWRTTESNRQARYYSITAAGRRQLASQKKSWTQMVAIMQTLFGAPT
jgi:PadR family transcriptional regulator, regulatory protein PadR